MKNFVAKLISILVLVFLFPTSVNAITNPLSTPNNRFGIHIFSEKDLKDAQNLVNSTGGDWGYITVVITEAERDHDRWQSVFDEMRRLHLIPIVRLATKASGSVWEKPKLEEINNWIAFLNSLNWVIQNRYVVIGNEPNLANEWGGNINAGEYVTYLKDFSVKLKSASNDFFVLPAGLAPEPNEYRFIRDMIRKEPNIYDYVDGFVSHPYPTKSIDLYNLELTWTGKKLPVFITETGWNNKNLNEDDIGKKLVDAYQTTWNDPRIIAVTPFILNYPQAPFNVFSWTKSDGTHYSFFNEVANLKKIKGEPIQITKGEILTAFAQPIIPLGSDYVGLILTKNTGQSIWSANNISIGSDFVDLPIKSYSFQDIEPTRLGLILFKAASPETTGIYGRSLFLKDSKNNRVTNSFPIEAYVVKIDWNKIQEYFKSTISHFSASVLK